MEPTTSLKTFEVTIPEQYADTLKKFIKALEGKVKAQKKTGLEPERHGADAAFHRHRDARGSFLTKKETP